MHIRRNSIFRSAALAALPLSVLLFSAIAGAQQAPPSLSLPATVTGVQTATTGPAYSTIDLTVPSGSYVITSQVYDAWCTNPFGYIPGDIGLGPGQLYDPSGEATYSVYSSYAANLPNDGNAGNPGQVLNGTETLSQAQEWQLINYVLNYPKGSNGSIDTTMSDMQNVIWQILWPTSAANGTTFVTTPAATALYQDALENGLGFVPGPGQVIAIILDPQTPSDSPKPFQGVLIAVPLGGDITLIKSASVKTANCFEKVTYSYTVQNTGNVTLTNVQVVDDNGTPDYPDDDFVAGTVASLEPGASQTFTKSVYLPLTLYSVDADGNENWSTLIASTLPNGNLQVSFIQDQDLVDNTYGANSDPGWGNQGNSFTNYLNSDAAEFSFEDTKGNTVLDFHAGYLSQNSKKPSGYGSGISQGWGGVVAGSASNIVSVDSSLSDNLNRSSSYYRCTNSSPKHSDHKWENDCRYTVVVKCSAFKYGFGRCDIKKVHHSRCKNGGGNYTPPTPVCSKVTNTATVTASIQGSKKTVTATATATVTVNAPCQTSCDHHKHKCWQHRDCKNYKPSCDHDYKKCDHNYQKDCWNKNDQQNCKNKYNWNCKRNNYQSNCRRDSQWSSNKSNNNGSGNKNCYGQGGYGHSNW